MSQTTIEGFELSVQQHRLWERAQAAGSAPSAGCLLRVHGPADGARVRAGLERAIERHEILRTRFRRVAGLARPLQVVAEAALEWSDAGSAGDPGELDESGGGLLDRLLDPPWALEGGPVVRAAWVALGEGRSLLALAAPALVSDAAGLVHLAAEALAAEPGDEGEPPLQYIDFAEFQRQELESAGEGDEGAYWHGRLEVPPPALPLDGVDPAAPPAARPARACLDVEPAVTEALRACADRLDVPLEALALAAWTILLWRHGAAAGAPVAVAFDGRHHPELAGLPGPYTQLLPVATHLAPESTAAQAAQRVAAELAEAAVFQDAFDPRALAEAAWRPDLAFSWRERDRLEPAGGLELEVVERVGLPERPLATLEGRLGSDRLRLAIDHDPGLCDAESAHRLLARYRILLGSIVEAPARRLDELELLDASDRAAIEELGAGGREVPPPRPLDALVERQAEATPEAIALVGEGEHVSYGELVRRARELAGRLRSLGVGAEDVVGVCAERSAGLPVALLAVLRAGGAYLPLDPSYPEDRLAQMVADAGPRALLCAPGQEARFADVGVPVVRLPGAGAPSPCDDGGESPAPPPGALHDEVERLAYVLYTSGSTGRPKGVAVPHRAIVNRLLWMATSAALGPGDRVVQKTPTSFDASIWEIFAPLLFGATVELARPEGSGDMDYLAELVAERRVTVLQLVPSLFRLYLGAPAAARGGDLRHLFCGGEPLAADLVERSTQVLSAAELHNLYGPTETAIDASWQRVAELPEGEAAAVVPIGRPLAHLRIDLLDPAGRPVPPGVAGEIVVSGRGVARGYRGRPGATAERFVPAPAGGGPGARAYRTGDLGRWRPDGRLEFRGRLDRQVKLQGVRIEPAEVERALLAHPEVSEAVVAVREMPEAGGRRLVAWVAAPAGAPAAVELRRHLESRLPSSMLPAAFVACRRLPRTPSGKLDHGALPDPPAPEEARQPDAAAPEAITRDLLANLWRELLDVDAVGPRDDFFDLGGHSLLATRLVSRLRRTFGVEVSMRQIFDTPTLGALASAIERARRGAAAALPPLRPVSRDGALPVSFSQQRLWFLDQLDPGNPAYDLPFGARLIGSLDLPALAGGLRGVVARHEALRTRFPSHEGQPRQEVLPRFHLPVPLVDLSALPERRREVEVARRARAEARWSFDLSRGPLVRVCLLRLEAEEHVLLANLHHIVSDGWSTGLLLRELSILYRAAVERRIAPLPELEVQYPDYAAWQREVLVGEALDGLIAHWRERLAGRPPSLGLPTDRPRPAAPSLRGGRRAFALPGELVRDLQGLARSRDATLFMTVLAGLYALLHRYGGGDDLVVGSPVAGRTLAETEPLIGFFVNTLVLRTRVEPELPFSGAIERVRETALDASAHQELPFEKLVEVLQPDRDVRRPPLVEVVLAFQTAPSEELRMPGLRLEPMRTGTGGVKFDLVLDLRPGPEPEGGLVGAIEYASDLFDETTVARLGGHLVELLRGAAAGPERPLAELPLLGRGEHHQVVREWRATGASPPTAPSLRRAFRDQAERTPDRVAVSCDGRSLTYGELARRARRLAGELVRAGVRPEVPVGILAERSEALVVGILAVVEAGGTYLPIDPVYPSEHVRYVLEDSAAPVLLVDGVEPPALERVRVVPISAPHPATGGPEAEDPGAEPPPGAAAYVIYTSGSTGRQKGVPVSHTNVLRLFAATRDPIGFGEEDTWSLFHSIAFDFSVWELWGALLHGGRVVVVPWMVSRSPGDFAALLARERVTELSQTPSAFGQLVAADGHGAGGGLPDLRRVVFGGEALEPSALAPWFARHGDRTPRLINMYGITETTVHVTRRALAGADAAAPGAGSIGRAIPDLGVAVVDPRGLPVPAGVPGELLVAGAGLARGYLGRPGLSAERFVPRPGGGRPGERAYRSGDLARLRADGELDYVGRIDHQVKVRGHRVELGEIEARLLAHPGVSEAAVIARGAGAETRLLAYAAVREDDPPAAPELRAFLALALPRHMVPASVTILDALPLTPNGKLDRRALPEPEPARPDLDREFLAPRNAVEEVVAGIWCEVLGFDRVGVEDDFFDLGGHSLQATQVVARLRQRFRTELPLRAFFAATTVAALARRLSADEPTPGRTEKLAEILLRVDRMSAHEVKGALRQRDLNRGESR